MQQNKHLVSWLIIAIVCGEALALVYFGVIRQEYAAAYCILATWIKDKLHKFLF